MYPNFKTKKGLIVYRALGVLIRLTCAVSLILRIAYRIRLRKQPKIA